MNLRGFLRACVLASLAGAFIPGAYAQQLSCQSRLVEETFQRAVKEKYGPTAFAQIQAIAGGQEVPMQVTVTSVETVSSTPGGWPAAVCSASANFWRGDTGQTMSVSAEFWLLISQGGGTQIQVQRWGR
jgi:hypothetical protein